MGKVKTIVVRVSESLKTSMEKEAAKLGVSVGEVARRKMEGSTVEIKVTPKPKEGKP